ncbi:MAG TPA: hypothetical protein VGI45_20345 [Terracidiphilus sp.]
MNQYNDTIQKSLYIGWSKLSRLANEDNFFDIGFYNYITLRSVSDPRDSGVDNSPRAIIRGEAGKSSAADFPGSSRGVCDRNTYCLGYSTLFRPAQPRLTDMLLTLIAAKNPAGATSAAVDAIEGGDSALSSTCGTSGKTRRERSEHDKDRHEHDELQKELLLASAGSWSLCSCQEADKRMLLGRLEANRGDQRLPLECFRAAMQIIGAEEDKGSAGRAGVPELGILRAALADFLFNYKLSQQYPHEFAPYDLTSSAQALDSTLSPIIHAFNEDLQAFQSFVRAQVIVGSSSMKLSGDKNAFLNDGIITVQTTSGDIATVNTGTQSYLNVSKAPSISQLASSIMGANAGGSSNPITGVLSNLSGNEAQVIMGALAAYQTTTLNIGRQLNLTVKPRSLLGASAAEMDVQLNADQAPNTPNYWTASAGPGSQADLSAVTQHDVTTHVRIDSIRLFDVSSLTAMLSKGRDKFPLFPPFVEIPYIGTLLGIPLPSAREYHTSDVVISAVIVPTATDIAYSLRYATDKIVVGNKGGADTCDWKSEIESSQCALRRATSLSDFGSKSVREFHRLRLHCFLTMGVSPFPTDPGKSTGSNEGGGGCSNLKFSDALRDASE